MALQTRPRDPKSLFTHENSLAVFKTYIAQGGIVIVRRSPRPSKQLLWLLLQRDMKHSQGKEVGVDVGCGKMGNYRLFQTQRYIGIDLDKSSLEAGQKKYPEAEAVCTSIEEATNIKGDYLLCVQVFNNINFDAEKTADTVKALCSMVKSDGALIFNIGKDSKKYEQDIDAILFSRFQSIKKLRYGSSFSTHKRPMIVSLIFALAMLNLPILGRMGEYQKIYYLCNNKAD